MLFKKLRKHTKTIMWGIAIFIVPAFVIWNIGSAVKNRRSGFAGKIFNKKVSWVDFTQEKNAVRNDIKMRYGEQPEQYSNIDEQTWTRLIILNEAKKAKIKVSDKELLEFIKNLPVFKFAKLAPENYAMIITRVFQQTPAEFESGIRHSIIINKLMEKLTEDLIASDMEVENAYRQEFEQASVSYILIEPETFQEAVPSDNEDDLKGYYENNKEKFRKKEQVNVKYIQMKLEQFKGTAQITDEQIKTYYENNKNEFKVEKDNIQKESPLEYKSLEQVSESIKDKLLEKEMLNQASGLSRTIMNKLYGDVSFDDVAKEHGLVTKETGPFSMFDQIPDIGLNFPFLKAAFSLKIGEVSQVIQTPAAFYILKPIKKIEPYIPGYEDAKIEVKKLYIEAQAQELARQKSDQLRSEFINIMKEKKISFKKASEELGFTVKEADNIARTGYITALEFNKEFAEAAFKLNKDAISAPIKTQSGFCLISLNEIKPLDMDKFKEKKAEYSIKVLNTKKAEFLNNWFEAIKLKANAQSYLDKEKM
ncbi:MAG: peptidyl-prolyl cis-trans isomerase [Candidatus Omnitrophica bacterium]|nr:peptidyl-prolyl cis-trans isomerase [Candidatus Omnitrophota bacterium]